MNDEWEKVTLKEIGELARGKSKHRPRYDPILYGGKYPFIQTGDVKSANKKVFTYEQTYNDVGLAQSKLWQKGTLCITIAANIAESAILGIDACFPDSVVGFIPDENKANVDYIYYYLQLFKNNIQQLAYGTVQDNINLKTFDSIYIPLPPLEVQQRIASILNKLDDKIDLNLKMNETLEEMAKTLYKHWFIDFGLFDTEDIVNTEQGELPKEWTYKSINEIADILMGQSPRSEFYNQEESGLPFHQGVKDFGERFPRHLVYCSKELRVANEGDILISVRAPVGRINIANTRLIIGRGLCAVNSKTGHNSFLLYTLKNIFAEEDQHGSGTVFNSINKKDIEKFRIVYPSIEVLDNFEGHVSKYDKQIRENSIEVEQLKTLRDYLLPRLLSGEINLPDAEKKVKEFV